MIVDKDKIKKSVKNGSPVDCNLGNATREEYLEVRGILQQLASESIDNGEMVYAMISLSEVRRLDSIFGGIDDI